MWTGGKLRARDAGAPNLSPQVAIFSGSVVSNLVETPRGLRNEGLISGESAADRGRGGGS